MRGAIRVAGLLATPVVVVVGGLQTQVPKARITLTGAPQAGTYEMTGSPRLRSTFSGETAGGVRMEGSVACR